MPELYAKDKQHFRLAIVAFCLHPLLAQDLLDSKMQLYMRAAHVNPGLNVS
jgi:hypothetical protein